GGVKTVMIPIENQKDLADIPDNVKQGMEIIPVESIDQVLEHALSRRLVPYLEEIEAIPAESPAKPSDDAGSERIHH
ncbi:MAG: endopeptidase La, partial [Alphaproteobacteria bacterium]|nr:endopeptidase La [Alphaproteobacteria bacterium]